jgi:hypothetical protein|tara:strand:+ start:4131 stop:4265 length:135 start_codon:yes stop_codon:yes gene_type:complete
MRNINWSRAKTNNMPEWMVEDEMANIFDETLNAYKEFLGGEFLE